MDPVAARLALALGWALALLAGAIFLPPIYHWRVRANGGPFKEGDQMQILSGRHASEVSMVYSKWQGTTVRVKLTPQDADEYKDVFQSVELLKVPE